MLIHGSESGSKANGTVATNNAAAEVRHGGATAGTRDIFWRTESAWSPTQPPSATEHATC